MNYPAESRMSLSALGLQDNDRRSFAPADAEMNTQEKTNLEIIFELPEVFK